MTQISSLDLFLAAFLLLTAANGETHQCLPGFAPDVSEQQPASVSWRNHKRIHLIYFANTFSLWLWSGLTAGKWSVPSRRALICRPTCCPWTHSRHCSLNSAGFQAESAQPGDRPLWDQSAARKRIWGARLSALWSVIPQINTKIMCKACVPIMLFHVFRKVTRNLELRHGVYWKWWMEMRSIKWTQAGEWDQAGCVFKQIIVFATQEAFLPPYR